MMSKLFPETIKKGLKRLFSFIPPRLRQGKNYRRLKYFLSESQVWDKTHLQKWQLGRLQKVMHFAFDQVPGYRQLFTEKGVRPGDLRSLQDLSHFPFVTKELIRDHLHDFTSVTVRPEDRHYVTTGGSTGIPFGFFHTRINAFMEPAFMHSSWERRGWQLGDCSAVLRGAFVGSQSHFWEFDPFNRELQLSGYFLSENNFSDYLEKMKEYGVQHLQAYPSLATMLAEMILRNDVAGKAPLKIILLGSENLYHWQKEKIQRAFPQSRIFSWYGHAEEVILASMCETSDLLHVWPQYGVTEILNADDQPVVEGQTGELVGTSLWNFGTPFIRYRTRDFASRGPEQCSSCHRNFQLLSAIEGRLQEVVISGKGRKILMTAINMHDDIFDHVKQFQFYQEKQGVVIFRYIPKGALTSGRETDILCRLKEKFGDDVQLIFQKVESIERTNRGKFRFLEQKLPIPECDP